MPSSRTLPQSPSGYAPNTDARRIAEQPILLLWVVIAIAMLELYIGLTSGKSALGEQHHVSMVHAQTIDGASEESQRPASILRPLSCERLPDIPGKAVTTALLEFPPGGYSPAHRHPGSVTAFVLRGTLRSQLAGSPIQSYGAGQTWFEPPGVLHLFAENASTTEPAELLVVFVADQDCGPLVIPER